MSFVATRLTEMAELLGLFGGSAALWRHPTPAGMHEAGEACAVVIPARDEEQALPGLLVDLASQLHPADELVVVDDDSADATAAAAAVGGAKVVRVDGPPPGWTGKAWALATGVSACEAPVLVFLDADVRLARGAIARVVASHRRLAPDGLLSVQPRHITERAYEQASAIANVVAVMASGMGAVRPPRSSGVAFGPCLVVRRDDLEAVGGWASVAGEVLEDAALAARFRSAGRPVRCLAGGESVAFRMHRGGPRHLVDGWAKQLAGGAGRAPRWPTLAAVTWVSALVAITIGLFDASPLAVAIYALAAAQVSVFVRRVGRFRWWVGPLFPLPVAAFVGLFSWSAVQTIGLRRATWRGRTIRIRAD